MGVLFYFNLSTEPEIAQGRKWSRMKVRKEGDVQLAIDCIKTALNIIR